jgi:hypothetical protein
VAYFHAARAAAMLRAKPRCNSARAERPLAFNGNT